MQIKIYLKNCLSSSCCISQEVGEYIEFLDEVTENKELKDLVGKLIKYYFANILANTFICDTQEFSAGRHGRIHQRL